MHLVKSVKTMMHLVYFIRVPMMHLCAGRTQLPNVPLTLFRVTAGHGGQVIPTVRGKHPKPLSGNFVKISVSLNLWKQ